MRAESCMYTLPGFLPGRNTDGLGWRVAGVTLGTDLGSVDENSRYNTVWGLNCVVQARRWHL